MTEYHILPAGILAAIGGPVLKPGSPTYLYFFLKAAVTSVVKGVRFSISIAYAGSMH
jgi:hypothetical protein